MSFPLSFKEFLLGDLEDDRRLRLDLSRSLCRSLDRLLLLLRTSLSLKTVRTIKVFDKLNKPTYLCHDLCFYPFFAPWTIHVLCLLSLSCFPLHPFLFPSLFPSPSPPMKLEVSLAPPNSICSETQLKQKAKTELSTQKKKKIHSIEHSAE